MCYIVAFDAIQRPAGRGEAAGFGRSAALDSRHALACREKIAYQESCTLHPLPPSYLA